MKVSELIAELQKAMAEHGDHDLYVSDILNGAILGGVMHIDGRYEFLGKRVVPLAIHLVESRTALRGLKPLTNG